MPSSPYSDSLIEAARKLHMLSASFKSFDCEPLVKAPILSLSALVAKLGVHLETLCILLVDLTGIPPLPLLVHTLDASSDGVALLSLSLETSLAALWNRGPHGLPQKAVSVFGLVKQTVHYQHAESTACDLLRYGALVRSTTGVLESVCAVLREAKRGNWESSMLKALFTEAVWEIAKNDRKMRELCFFWEQAYLGHPTLHDHCHNETFRRYDHTIEKLQEVSSPLFRFHEDDKVGSEIIPAASSTGLAKTQTPHENESLDGSEVFDSMTGWAVVSNDGDWDDCHSPGEKECPGRKSPLARKPSVSSAEDYDDMFSDDEEQSMGGLLKYMDLGERKMCVNEEGPREVTRATASGGVAPPLEIARQGCLDDELKLTQHGRYASYLELSPSAPLLDDDLADYLVFEKGSGDDGGLVDSSSLPDGLRRLDLVDLEVTVISPREKV